MFDLSIVSLDIANIDHASEINLIFAFLSRKNLRYFPESSIAFPGIFNSIPQSFLEHFPESSWPFPGILKWEHSPESSKRFHGIVVNIPHVTFHSKWFHCHHIFFNFTQLIGIFRKTGCFLGSYYRRSLYD